VRHCKVTTYREVLVDADTIPRPCQPSHRPFSSSSPSPRPAPISLSSSNLHLKHLIAHHSDRLVSVPPGSAPTGKASFSLCLPLSCLVSRSQLPFCLDYIRTIPICYDNRSFISKIRITYVFSRSSFSALLPFHPLGFLSFLVSIA